MKENTLELPGSMELSDREMKTIYGGGGGSGVVGVIWDAMNNF